jgi:transposase
MGRTRAKPVVLDAGQTAMLTKISRAKSEELRRVQRAKILLMASAGEIDDRIAEAVGLNKNSVRNTIAKFTALGLRAALTDLPRSGRPPLIGDDAKAWVRSLAGTKPEEFGYDQELWTHQKLTEHIRGACGAAGFDCLKTIAPSKVWTILHKDGINHHRVHYYLGKT